MKKNPGYYKLKNCTQEQSKLSAETRLESIFVNDIELLSQNEFVVRDNAVFQSTGSNRLTLEYGKIMASHCLSFNTMTNFIKLKEKPNMRSLLETLCSAEEFSATRFHQDKGNLNALNKHSEIRFKINGKVQTTSQKVNLLIQCLLGSVPLTTSDSKNSSMLSNETNLIMPEAVRVVRGIPV
jgi:Sec63 Brl domain